MRQAWQVSIRAPGEPGAIHMTYRLWPPFRLVSIRAPGEPGAIPKLVPEVLVPLHGFNPRPRRTGGDTTRYVAATRTSSTFQSAPPANRGRYPWGLSYDDYCTVSIRAPGEPGAIRLSAPVTALGK